jgi:hypothetical protein
MSERCRQQKSKNYVVHSANAVLPQRKTWHTERAYQAFVLSYGFTPPEAAGSIAFIVGLLARRRK